MSEKQVYRITTRATKIVLARDRILRAFGAVNDRAQIAAGGPRRSIGDEIERHFTLYLISKSGLVSIATSMESMSGHIHRRAQALSKPVRDTRRIGNFNQVHRYDADYELREGLDLSDLAEPVPGRAMLTYVACGYADSLEAARQALEQDRERFQSDSGLELSAAEQEATYVDLCTYDRIPADIDPRDVGDVALGLLTHPDLDPGDHPGIVVRGKYHNYEDPLFHLRVAGIKTDALPTQRYLVKARYDLGVVDGQAEIKKALDAGAVVSNH